ncbi:MAG: DNA-binding protein AraC-type [Acidobacteriaceae bacterium]|nr:DNA-binding protein AraC-type [Acidobacteriaceae bacterium]
MVEQLTRLTPFAGVYPTSLDGVSVMRVDRSSERVPVLYDPSIVIVAQGRKHGYLGPHTFTYDAGNYLVLTVPLPFECETIVAPDGPFLAFSVRVDLAILSELVMKMEARGGPTLVVPAEQTVSATPMDASLSDAAVRLLECLNTPADTAVLGPQIVREILYRALCGEQGPALKSLLMMDSARNQIHRILHRLHAEYTRPVDIRALAGGVGMSVSALHHHFKAVTSTSPLRYLKTIRLHKARLLMVQDAVGASVAAEKVGYESPSQFSREFKRLFGATPVDETHRMRASLGGGQASLAQAG